MSGGSAWAADPTQAEEVSGLFVQACLQYAGDPQGLREWVRAYRLPALPPQGQEAFLAGRSGIAYDASTPRGKFVLISGDDGTCSALTDHADPAVLAATLPQLAQQAGVSMQPVGEHQDPKDPALTWRDFRAAKGSRHWSVLLGTASSAPAAYVILTATAG